MLSFWLLLDYLLQAPSASDHYTCKSFLLGSLLTYKSQRRGTTECTNIGMVAVPEGIEGDKGIERTFEEIIVLNFSNLMEKNT